MSESHGRTAFIELVRSADAMVSGYRPGAIDRLGLALPDVRPGLIRGAVSAWGTSGQWANRRGFDSIVQAASGISLIEGSAAEPGALPVQALDHATGYILAAAVIDALAARATDGHGRDVAVALGRTAASLLRSPGREESPTPHRLPGSDVTVAHGQYVTARPALSAYADYPHPARRFGGDSARWMS